MCLIGLGVALAAAGFMTLNDRTGEPERREQNPKGASKPGAVYDELAVPSPPDAQAPLPALNRPRVVIFKTGRRLLVYNADTLVKVYRVTAGAVAGDKVREGDLRTPEGHFYICVRNPRSKFTLSLGLSYPNIEDAERGLRDGLIGEWDYRRIVEAVRARRQPPWKTALGGEIMIHGAGADRGGTLGCVGMDDGDIRELYRRLPLGTPVEIRP